jgi:hypothetical protein
VPPISKLSLREFCQGDRHHDFHRTRKWSDTSTLGSSEGLRVRSGNFLYSEPCHDALGPPASITRSSPTPQSMSLYSRPASAAPGSTCAYR